MDKKPQEDIEHLVHIGYSVKKIADSLALLRLSFEAYNKEVKEYIELLDKKRNNE